MSWVGLDNYAWLFTNPAFYNALWKTITIGVLSTVPQLRSRSAWRTCSTTGCAAARSCASPC